MTGPEDVRRAMGWQERHPALAIRCPRCNAPEGQRCTTPSGRRPLLAPHLARIETADHPPVAHPPAQPPC